MEVVMPELTDGELAVLKQLHDGVIRPAGPMAARTGLDPKVVEETLRRLLAKGLVEQRGPKWRITYDGKLSLGLSPAHPALNIEQAVDRLTTADQGDALQVAASQIVLLSNFYGLALDQARRSFRWALVASIVGLLFFLGAVAFVLQEKGSNAAIVSVISGAIVELLAGVNFYLYAKTTGQLSLFHARLDVTQRFLLANSLCESLEGEIKQKTRSDLIARLTIGAGGASRQGTQ
jgi:hypothetical protein